MAGFKHRPRFFIRLTGKLFLLILAGIPSREDLVAGFAERLPQFSVFAVSGNANARPLCLQGFRLAHGIAQGLVFNQGFRSLNNALFKSFVLLSLGIQRRLELFQQVVEPFLNRAIVAKFHGPGRFPLFTCGLVYAFGRFPVNVIPVGVVEECA